MKVINGAAFRNKQAKHLDECEQSNVTLLVMTQKQGREPQQMIVIPKEQYDLINDEMLTLRQLRVKYHEDYKSHSKEIDSKNDTIKALTEQVNKRVVS